jgi:hypothetical protein
VTKILATLAALHIGSGISFAQNPLPAPWQHTDVGDVGIPGNATESNEHAFVLTGAGSDIWGTSDSFHFMYQPLDHDGEILGRSLPNQGQDPFAKIGIMIRRTLDPGSPHVVLDLKPDGTVELMTRATQDGPTTFIAGAPQAGELRLVRENGVVTGVVCNFPAGGTFCHAIGSAPFPSGPALTGGVITSHDRSTLNQGSFPSEGLHVYSPRPAWLDRDVGSTGLAGSASQDNGTWTVKGAGADIWGTADAYHEVAKSLDGDGEVLARVTSEDAANSFAKAGVVVGYGSGFETVILDIRPNGVIEFMARPTPGGNMQFLAGSAASLPVWLKIERRGDQLTGLMSPDGHDWQVVGVTSVSFSSPSRGAPSAGLAVTSHDTSSLNTATFDHFAVAAGHRLTSADIGDVGIAGEELQAFDAGVDATEGGGADIWGSADAFNFVYRSLMDDGQMVIRVRSLDNTNSFAKVGLMIRDSLDPSAAHVLVDVTPSSLVEVLTRPSNGGETQWIGGLSPTAFPIWLKLTRSGQTFDAFASADGSTWTHLAAASSTTIASDALIGIATTSHVRGVVTTATFDPLIE